MNRNTVTDVLLAVIIVMTMQCTVDTVSGGNTSEVGNGAVAGILYEPDGTTPAAGAKVFIRPRTTLADTTGLTGLSKRMADTATVMTDDSGRFVFDTTLDTGLYVIEANQGDTSLALIDSVHVTAPADTQVEVVDTLRPAGSITGVIYLSEGGDPRKVFILAFGINRFTMPDTTGRFSFDSLAEAVYDLRILSSLDNYAVLDTFGVPVVSEQVTNLDTLRLPYTGIPTPKGLALSYDTLKQIVTLTWNQADTSLIQGYNVYRTHADSTGRAVQINSAVVTDTMFSDSTATQDQTYIYQVKAVDKNGNEGLLSAGVGVEVVGAFAFVDSIGSGILHTVKDLIIRTDNRIFITDDTTGLVIFNSSGIHQTTIACASFAQVNLKRVRHMAEDNRGNLYVTGVKDQIYGGKGVVLKFSSQDSLLRVFGDIGGTDSALGFPGEITLLDTFVYVENTDDRKIKVFSSNTGIFLFSFGGAGSSQGQFVEIGAISVDSENHIWVLEKNRMQYFDIKGMLIGFFEIDIGLPSGLCITNGGEIFTFSVTNKSIYGFNSSGNISSKFTPRELSSKLLFVDSSAAFYLLDTNYSLVLKYK